jgi:hypothetical protein
MRPALSTDSQSGTTRFQADDDINEDLSHDVNFHELLGVTRDDYERQDVAAPKAEPMATAPWVPMASVLQTASDVALSLELLRRGYEVAGNVLQNRWPSGKRKHKKHKSKKRGHQK